MKESNVQKSNPKQEASKSHPMWFFVFFILGLTLSISLNNFVWILFGVFSGIIMMLITTKSPSSYIVWKKTNLESNIVWTVIIIIALLLTLIVINNYGDIFPKL